MLRGRKLKLGRDKDIIIIDFSDKFIKLPNGDIISPNDIVNYDSKTGLVTYITSLGELKQLYLSRGDTINDEAVKAFLSALVTEEKDKIDDVMHV